MSLVVKFDIDKRRITAFEEFMTDDLQEETKRAYARTLNRLGRGCANALKRKLGKSQNKDDQEIFKAGISWSPKKIGQIYRLNPLRAYVGAGSSRKRYYAGLIGSPFRARITDSRGGKIEVIAQRNKKTKHKNHSEAWEAVRSGGRVYESHQSFVGYRNTALPISVLSPINLTVGQTNKFRYMVEEYFDANHDRVFDQEFKKAVEKKAKKKR